MIKILPLFPNTPPHSQTINELIEKGLIGRHWVQKLDPKLQVVLESVLNQQRAARDKAAAQEAADRAKESEKASSSQEEGVKKSRGKRGGEEGSPER